MSRKNRNLPRKEYLLGFNAVWETLRANRRQVMEVQISSAHRSEQNLKRLEHLAQKRGVSMVKVSKKTLEKNFAKTAGPGLQSTGWVGAWVSPYSYASLDGFREKVGGIILACDRFQDPHNLGAVLRTLHALGGRGAIITSRQGVGVSPTVVRGSAGAAEHLEVARVVNLGQALEQLKEAGFWLAASSPVSDENSASSQSILDLEKLPQEPLVLVLGQEHQGLRPNILAKCHYNLSIPMVNPFNSLNVSVSAGILLWALKIVPNRPISIRPRPLKTSWR